MKSNRLQTSLSLVLLFTAAPNAWPQGAFVNLDFESANIIPDPTSPIYPHAVFVSDALPGWTAYIGGTQVPEITYDTVSLSEADISIHDSNGSIPILEGSYTVLLQPSFPGGAVIPSIGQVGTIPATARSMQFYAQGFPSVVFAGQQLGLVTLATTPTYSIYAADVSALANQTGELRFLGHTTLDNIFFSPSVIPEPSLIGLSGLGFLLLGWRFVRKARRTGSRG